jgi:hypothetical protein
LKRQRPRAGLAARDGRAGSAALDNSAFVLIISDLL